MHMQSLGEDLQFDYGIKKSNYHFKYCPDQTARIGFIWVSSKDLCTDKLQFQKPRFNTLNYFQDLAKDYSQADLNDCGFNSIRDIDNCYDILVHDLEDMMVEIDHEKKKMVKYNHEDISNYRLRREPTSICWCCLIQNFV